MRRPEYLYLHEMRDAVVRIIDIVGTSSRAEIEQDRNRADALMWNYTVLGEAAAGLPRSSGIGMLTSPGAVPLVCVTGSFTATGPLTWRFWL